MRALTKAAVAAVATAIAIGVAGCSSGSSKPTATPVQLTAATSSSATSGPSINVAGHGEVSGTPDVMTVTMGVQTIDPSAQAALQHDNDRANQLVSALKAQGVAAKDIQTIDLNVSPNFDKSFKVTGYSASNTVSAKLRDLSKAGEVIDAAALTVGDDIRLQGVSFSIDNTSALVAKARADAVRDALAQGGQLAQAAGVKLGAIRTIDDTGTQLPQPRFLNGSTGHSADVPISPGTQQLSVDVTVVFDLST
ncbi:MAG: hypothetical protein JWM72_3943 [Actinomycetia bacterium]|nr:hypothetical protein [Actinomycetes bacterium]